MNPKKILLALSTMALVAGFALPTISDAGSYRSRVEGTCAYCNKPVYSYYRPVGYDRYGRSTYSWVMSQHTSCRNKYRSSSSHSYSHNHSRYHRGYTRSRPSIGFSINFGSSPYYSSGYRSYGYGSYSRGYRYGRGGYCR